MIRVKDEPDLVRSGNGVVQNTNGDEYRSFIIKRNSALENQKRLEHLEKDNKELHEKLDFIIKLLKDKT